jgi:S1-C subfamily serine protease
MFDPIRQSILRVLDRTGRTAGSAFFVQPSGFVVTCAHVIANCEAESIVLEFVPGDDISRLTLRAALQPQYFRNKADEDIAVLVMLDPVPITAAPLTLTSSYRKIDDSFRSYGFPGPKKIEGAPGRGKVVGYTREKEGGQPALFVKSDEITQGFSGAPAIDDTTGQVIGMIVATATADAQGKLKTHAYLIPSETIVSVCSALVIRHEPIVERLITLSTRGKAWKSKYVSLQRAVQDRTEIFVPLLLQRVPEGHAVFPQPPDPVSASRLFADASAHQQANVLIVGGAGAGKSRLLRHFASLCWNSPREIGLDSSYVPITVSLPAFARARGLSFVEKLTSALDSCDLFPSGIQSPEKALDGLLDDTRYKFLILLDAFDEIIDPVIRSDACDLLLELAQRIGARRHQVVVFSRGIPELSRLENFKGSAKPFFVYVLKELDGPQRKQFASEYLGANSAWFLKKIEKMPSPDLWVNPLTFSIALRVYSSMNGDLPSRLIQLFERFISVVESGWRTREDVDTFGQDALRLAVDALGELALCSLNDKQLDEQRCIDTLSDFMKRKHGASPASAGKEAINLLAFVSTQTGLFFLESERYGWSHSSIRDYLAASSLVARSDRAEFDGAFSRWTDLAWKNAIIYALAMLPESRCTEYINTLLKLHWARGHELVAEFVVDVLRVGAEVSGSFRQAFVDELLGLAMGEQADFTSDQCRRLITVGTTRVFALDLLPALSSFPEVLDALHAITFDDRSSSDMKQVAAEAIGHSALVRGPVPSSRQ